MTKREIIYDVIERMKAYSDDSDMSQEHISSVIDTSRALLIERKYSKKSWNTITSIQQKLCLGLEVVSDVNGFECFGTILRSEDLIPDGINFTGADSSVLRVMTYDKKKLHASIVPIERLPYLGHDEFTNNLLYVTIDPERRLYFFSNYDAHKMLSAVQVNGVYVNPEKASELSCQDYDPLRASYARVAITPQLPHPVDPPVEPWDLQYPIEIGMIEPLMDIIIKKLTRREALPEDNLNDSEDTRK